VAKMRILLACLLILQFCSSSKIPLTNCTIDGFTASPLEHMIETAERPFVVRQVKGQLTWEGVEWPEGEPILFEIRGPWPAEKIARANADAKGNFEIPGVAAGRYCFKATVSGWRSVIGVIKVDKHADPTRQIRIVMLLGV
jgi:hypothetical protein